MSHDTAREPALGPDGEAGWRAVCQNPECRWRSDFFETPAAADQYGEWHRDGKQRQEAER